MSTFWLIAALMVIIGLLFVNWPWLAFKQTSWARMSTLSALVIGLSSLLFAIVAIGLYLYWGSSQQLAAYYQASRQAQLVQQELKQIGSLQQVIAKLVERLQQQPDAKGWYLLGRLYFSQGQLIEALQAYANADRLQADDPKIMLAYAEALLLKDQTALPQVKQLLKQVLAKQPDNDEALNILAIALYQQGEYQQAITIWERLLTHMPAASEEAKQLLEAIAKAQAALPRGARPNAKLEIPVQVNIAEKVRLQVMPTDTVFIYAQAAYGPKMPLAIIRKQVKDLPLQVILDESMAMLPTMTLAKFKEIRIIARVSKSGQAIAQPGDWFAESAVFAIDQVPANLLLTIQNSWQVE